MNLHLVALLPLTTDGIIAISGHAADYRTVYRNSIAETFVVGILIKIRGYHLIPHPSWNTNLHRELSGSILIYRHHDITIPRVFRCLTQHYFFTSDTEVAFVGEEEVYIDVAILHGIDISWQ